MLIKKLIYTIAAWAMLITVNTAIADSYDTTYTTNEVTIIHLQGDGLPQFLINQLQLTPKQRFDIETIIAHSHKRLKNISQKIHDNQHAIEGMVVLHYDKSKLHQLTQQNGTLYGQQQFIEIDAKHQIFAILDPIQQHKVKQFIQYRTNSHA